MKRKIFAAFLSLMMVISMLPTSAFATEVDVPADCQHANAHWETVKEATCTEPGVKSAHCPDCDKDVEDKIPATGHAPKEEWVVVDDSYVPADCEHAGHETYVCPNCDGQEEGGSETRDIKEDPALGHDWDEKNPVEKKEADCKNDGYTILGCTRCDATKKIDGDKADSTKHVVKVEPLRKPTCTEKGIGRKYCTVCGENMGYTLLDADHEYVKDEAKSIDAKCDADGLLVRECSVCHHVDTKVITERPDHDWEVKDLPADCENPARTAKKCKNCGAEEVAQVVPGSKPLGHTPVVNEEESVEATCTKAGKKVTWCDVCHKELSNVEVPALGHNLVETNDVQDANCQYPAGIWMVCDRDGCDYKEVKAFTGELAVPATGKHTEKTIEGYPATCQKTGLTDGKICTVCGKVTVEQEKIPVVAHKATAGVTLREANCKEGKTGLARAVCEWCGEPMGYIVLKADHTPGEKTIIKQPSCKEEGLESVVCKVCGKELDPQPIPKLAHTPGEAGDKEHYVIHDATCTEGAYVEILCTVCGERIHAEQDKDHPALGHDYTVKVEDDERNVAATCETEGKQVYKCVRCEETEVKTVPTVGGTGKHAWKYEGMVDATCTENAKELYVCENCHAEDRREIPKDKMVEGMYATNHANKKTVEQQDPTCSEVGYTAGVWCPDCPDGGKWLSGHEEIPVDASKHIYGEAEPLRKATCTTTGIGRATCTACGKATKYVVLAKTEHTITDLVDSKDPTCVEDGYIKGICSGCKKEVTEVLKATGEHTYEKQTSNATCTEAGYEWEECSVCHALKGDKVQTAKALGHDFKDFETYKDDPRNVNPTCDKKGVAVVKCTRCDEIDLVDLGGGTGKHVWDEGVRVKPTCTKGEYVLLTCKECGATKTEEIPAEFAPLPALGHDYTKVIKGHAATCKDEGLSDGLMCSRCDSVKEAQKVLPVDPSAHKYGQEVVLRDADCNKSGIKRETCTLCGDSRYGVIPAGKHVEGEVLPDTIVEATCGKAGGYDYICAKCGATVHNDVPATGEHKYEVKNTPASCTEAGYAWEECSVCGALKGEKQKVEDALGHEFTVEVKDDERNVAPTCETAGKQVYKCVRCDETKVKDVPAVGKDGKHDYKYVNIVDATCTSDAKEKYECSICHKVELRDIALEDMLPEFEALNHKDKETITVKGTCVTKASTKIVCKICHEVLEEKTGAIDANNHVNLTESTVRPASCSATGIKRWTCADCGKSGYATIEKTAHTFDDTKVETTKQPTCTEEGVVSNKCTVCGETVQVGTLAKTDHVRVQIPGTDGWKCSVCGKVLVEPSSETCKHENTEVIPAVEPTCTATGLTEGKKCSVCHKVLVEQDVVAALGHVEEVLEGVAPTCETAGKTAGVKCSRCGEILKAQEDIAAKGHTPVEVPAVEATCETAGKTAGTKCSVCEKILSGCEDIAAKGHTPVEVPAVEATCETAGKTAGTKCSVCEKILSGCEDVAAKGHTPVDVAAVEATCETAGKTAGTKCADCGKTLSGCEDVPALGHDYQYVEDGEDEEGLWVKYVCTRCGGEKIDR